MRSIQLLKEHREISRFDVNSFIERLVDEIETLEGELDDKDSELEKLRDEIEELKERLENQ